MIYFIIMPQWAEPQRHTVVILSACLSVFASVCLSCLFLSNGLKVSAKDVKESLM